MSWHHDNVRSFAPARSGHRRRYASSAKVIPLHSHFNEPRAWRTFRVAALAVAWVLIAAATTLSVYRACSDVLGSPVPGWPWW